MYHYYSAKPQTRNLKLSLNPAYRVLGEVYVEQAAGRLSVAFSPQREIPVLSLVLQGHGVRGIGAKVLRLRVFSLKVSSMLGLQDGGSRV